MLIAIAIAEEIQGFGGSESFEFLNFLGLWKEVSQKYEKLLAFSPRKFRSSKLSEPPNPWISSAMAMAMSIYRTLFVLVSAQANQSRQFPLVSEVGGGIPVEGRV